MQGQDNCKILGVLWSGNMQMIPVSVNDKILNQFMPISVKGLGARWELWDKLLWAC